MAGLRGFHRGLRGFRIAHLAHHEHIRVLAQKSAQGGGEGEADLRVDLHLVDAGQMDLDRIFGGGDVAIGDVQQVQAGVQGDSLAAAGRAGQQHQALRPPQCGEIALPRRVLQPQLFDAELGGAGIEQAQHHFLAAHGGQGADAKVHCAGRPRQANAAVLRQATFRNVQRRHHLEPRGKPVSHARRGAAGLAQHAVDALADAAIAVVGFDVDVRCASLDRVQQHLPHVANHGGFVHVICRRGRGLRLFGVLRRQQRLGGVRPAALAQRGQLVRRHQHRCWFEAGAVANVVQPGQIRGVRHGHEQPLAPAHQWQQVRMPRRHLIQQVRRDDARVEGGEIQRWQA